MDCRDGIVRKDHSEPCGDFRVVKVVDMRKFVAMPFLFGRELADVLHLMIIYLDGIGPLVQTEHHL